MTQHPYAPPGPTEEDGDPLPAAIGVDASHRWLVDTPGTLRPFLYLAAPVLGEQLLHMLVGQSDTILTGHFLREPEYLAAVNSMVYLLWLLTEVFVFVAVGATALIARFRGARQDADALTVCNQALLLGLVLAAVATITGLAAGERLATWMSLEGRAAELAAQYLRIVFPVIPFIMLQVVSIACLRGAGDTQTGMWAMVLVNVVNVALSWGLCLGVGPLPRWGWEGIAFGTACGHVVGGLFMLIALLRGRAGLRYEWRLLRPQFPWQWRILRIGIPGGLDMLAVLFCQLWFVKLVNELGPLSAAAHGVALRIESLAFSPGAACQVAAATLVGQYLGAGQPRRAVRAVLVALAVCGGFMTVMSGLFLWQADALVGLLVHSSQQQVVELGAPLLRTIALGLPPLAAMMMFTAALRGAGDTRWPLCFTLVGFLGVRIPLTYLWARPDMYGVQGAWYAMLADVICRCCLVSLRFWHGGWKRVRV
jgi:putative MATE family efflux protein